MAVSGVRRVGQHPEPSGSGVPVETFLQTSRRSRVAECKGKMGRQVRCWSVVRFAAKTNFWRSRAKIPSEASRRIDWGIGICADELCDDSETGRLLDGRGCSVAPQLLEDRQKAPKT